MNTGLIDNIPPSAYLTHYEQCMKTLTVTSAKPIDQFLLDPLDRASIADFQNLLVAVQLVNHIEVLENETLMPLLVGLLRDTMSSNPDVKLFNSYFGFLSINLILRTIQVGVLSRLYIFGPFLGLATYDTEDTVTQPLAEAVIYELKTSMSLDGSGATSGTPLPLFDNGVLLPEIGGLSYEDSLFLLEAIWEDRKQFLMVMSRGSLFSLGWSALFYMIFKQLEAKKSSTTSDQWGHLRQLLYRYRLYTTAKDEELAECVCDEIETRSFSNEFAELPLDNNDCVDKEDARLIVHAYIARLASQSKLKGEFPSSMSLVLASQAPFEAIVKVKSYDLAPPCTNASIEHMWSELKVLEERCKLDGVETAIDQILIHVCHLSLNYNIILRARPSDMSSEHRVEFLRALARGEFVQIVGRTLLAYAMDLATGIRLDYGVCRCWRDLIFQLKRMTTILENRYLDSPAYLMFEDCYSDLQKTCHQNDIILGLFEPSHFLYKFARDSLQVLNGLLNTLSGFNRYEFDQLVPPINCAYSRCPAVCRVSASITKRRTACEGCLVTDYCSEECQIRDWEFGCPQPHRTRCGAVHKTRFH